jgi:hypothetical protein
VNNSDPLEPAPAFTSAPISVLRCVTTPSNGAVIWVKTLVATSRSRFAFEEVSAAV